MGEADPDSVPKVEYSPFGKALARRILEQGAITLAEYMEACAVEYYASRQPFGKDGDFTTSPELSPMFGECIGVWLADLWEQMGKPGNVQLVELGPGRGVLSAASLRVLGAVPGCRAAMTLHLVENSRALRGKQAEMLQGQSPVWHDRFEDVPPGPLLLVANEFVTALPIRQYIRKNGKWHEKMVAFDETAGEFNYTMRAEPADLTLPKGYPKPIDRDIFEVNEAANSVVEAISRRIDQHAGAALIIDYGSSTPGYGDTIQSFKRNKRVDILRNPGGQDVTANLNFSQLVDIASPVAQVHGPVTQAEFLMRLGIAGRAEAICSATGDAKTRGETRLALRRLTNTSDMGEKFKVLALTKKDGKLTPKGFTDGPDVSDHRY